MVQSHNTRYTYANAGRLAARKVQGGSTADLITQRYGYDSAERLAQIKYLKAEGQAGEQLVEQIDYRYDAAGRRTGKTSLNNNGIGQGETPMSATYDAANRMTGITLTVGAATKTYALSHDAAGNLTQKQNTADTSDKTTYAWDASNRLTQITQTGATPSNSISASFTYDAYGRRIQSSIAQGGQAAQTVQYLYEGQQALGEIRNGLLTNRLLTGLSLDETIARIAINSSGQKDAANSRIFMTDALNSVIAQLADDNTATLQNSYGYSPHGESTTVGPDVTQNPVQYTSRENDGTGLLFYRARYYDPVMKRFISSDPIGLKGGMNMYSYVEGDPVTETDPLGLATYMCTQPLHALGAAGSLLYSPSNNPLYHQYIGIVDRDGKVTTGGQDRAGGPWGPGKPSQGDGASPETQCKKVEDDNQCLEQCLKSSFASPRPSYSLVLPGITNNGKNCQSWANDTLSQCQASCKGKK